MRDILPPLLIDYLRDRYIAGVATAEASFAESSSDEDAVTGALGQALAMPEPVLFTSADGAYAVRIVYQKLRGRGRGAPEKVYGSDGVFQILVTGRKGEIVRRKGLPFQSKINWRGRSKKLAQQAEDMGHTTGEGLVIDFTPAGYKACNSEAVVVARGNRREIDRREQIRPLGQVLGRDFLECKIGTVGLYFDPESEQYGIEAPAEPRHLITTDISMIQ